MSSILTNLAATSALQTLRGITASLQSTQSQVSSGLRVAKASDNAAYWSISTSMKSDRSALSAVSDVLALGSAKIDTAYAGMDSVVDILSEFKAKLISAKEDAVDKTKIQSELDQLKQQILSVAQSASYNGENLLNTNVSDIHDNKVNQASVVSSFIRNSSGGVSVGTINFGLDQTSLFNTSGGGILQADPRDMKTIGGLRFDWDGGSAVDMSNFARGNQYGSDPVQTFTFAGPITFGSSDNMSFDVTVDADNPSEGNPDDQLPGPYDPGKTTSVNIDEATVNAALTRTDGAISTFEDYTTVLRYAMQQAGANANAFNSAEYYPAGQTKTWRLIPNEINITPDGQSGLKGSSIQIRNLSSTVSTSGFTNTSVSYGHRESAMTLDFQQFQVYNGVVVNFNLDVDGTSTSYSFDKDYVNNVLGETTGMIATSGDMATLLNSLINRPDVLISATSPGSVSVMTDVNQNRNQGEDSDIAFTDVNVNIEPIPTMNLEDIDITNSTGSGIDSYINYIELVSQKAIQGAAVLGSLKNRIDGQSDFASKLGDSIDSGVGRLVDTDMEAASAKLSAEQTQQKLAIQSLSIANQSPQVILSLFKN